MPASARASSSRDQRRQGPEARAAGCVCNAVPGPQSAVGIFTLLPLALRVLDKIEALVDTELSAIGTGAAPEITAHAPSANRAGVHAVRTRARPGRSLSLAGALHGRMPKARDAVPARRRSVEADKPVAVHGRRGPAAVAVQCARALAVADTRCTVSEGGGARNRPRGVSPRQLFRLQDRRGNDMLLGPTHEEEITQLVAAEVTSYRQLPLRLYQTSMPGMACVCV